MKIKQIVIEIAPDDGIELDGDLFMSIDTAKRLHAQLNEFFKPKFDIPIGPILRHDFTSTRPFYDHSRFTSGDAGKSFEISS